MKNLKALALILAFSFVIAIPVAAQTGEKKKVFEFEVLGKLSQDDAKKIDDLMKSRKGIFNSVTDPKTNRISVTAVAAMDVKALRDVLVYLGYESDIDHLVIRDE